MSVLRQPTARMRVLFRTVFMAALCLLALWRAAAPARGQDTTFLETKWRPALADLAAARAIEHDSLLQPALRRKAAQSFEAAGTRIQSYFGFKRVREWWDGAMRDQQDPLAPPVNDSRSDAFFPHLAAAYAYFQAARLYGAGEQEAQSLLYQRAADVLAQAVRQRHSPVYETPTVQKLRLLGELERNRTLATGSLKDRPKAQQNIQALLLQLNGLLAREGATDKARTKWRQHEEDTLSTASDIFGKLEIPQFVTDVETELGHSVDWPSVMVSPDQTNGTFHAEIKSLLLPVTILVRDKAGKELARYPEQAYSVYEKRPDNGELQITLAIPQDSAYYQACKRLHADAGIPAVALAALVAPVTVAPFLFAEDPKPVPDDTGTVRRIQIATKVFDKVASVEYQILDAQGKPVGSPIKKPYDPNAKELDLGAPLPAGDYQLLARVYGADSPDQKPLSEEPSKPFRVLAPGTGMVFIVAVDYYFDQSLTWMCDGAEELTRKLISLGYKDENIIRVYGRVHEPNQPAQEVHRVDLYPDSFRSSLVAKYTGVADSPLKGYVTGELVNDAFKQFLILARQRQASHILLYFGGHGVGGSAADKSESYDLLKLPVQTDKFSVTLWPQQILDDFKDNPNMTVIGFYDACREGAKVDGVEIPGETRRYCLFRSCKANQQSSTDTPDGAYGIKHSFFANALLDALQSVNTQQPMTATQFLAQMQSALAQTEKIARAKNWNGEQDLPNIAGNPAAAPLHPVGARTQTN